MPTFTFPSGVTVDLPEGMTLCKSPDAATYDCHAFTQVATTPAGLDIFTSHSCAAYARAADVFDQRREVAEREEYVRRAAAKGRRTDRLESARDHHARLLTRMLTEYAADPAPCTC